LFRITFALGGLEDVDLAKRDVAILLDALVRTNMAWLSAHPEVRFGQVPIAYEDEPQGAQLPGQECWQDMPTCMAARRDGGRAAGNRDLACWKVAELRLQGRPAKVGLIWSGRSFRCTVIDGAQELDPSRGRGLREVQPWERISFVLDLFKGHEDRPVSNQVLRYLLDALTEINALYLEKHPNTPSIADGRVIYREEPPGQEDWQDVPTCLRMGVADCDDLGPWLAAELRVRRGVDARAIVKGKMREDGAMLYHVQTELPDGSIEDPSVRLGMR
jgi:hypothetical protein